MNQSSLHQSCSHFLYKKHEMVCASPTMVPILHTFNYQYISVLFINLLDNILLINNTIICLILVLQFPMSSIKISHVLISTPIQFIYPLLTSLNESVSIFHSLFEFESINYEVLLFDPPLFEYLTIQFITQQLAIHHLLTINMISIYKPLEFNLLSHWPLHL